MFRIPENFGLRSRVFNIGYGGKWITVAGTAAFQKIKSQGFLKILHKLFPIGFRFCDVQGDGPFPSRYPKFSSAPSAAFYCIHFHTGTAVPPTFFSEKPPIFPFLKETILRGNEAKGLLPLPHFPKAAHSSDPSLTRTQKHLGMCVMGKTNKLEDDSLFK